MAVEIVTCGLFPGQATYSGYGRVPSVYEISEEQLAALMSEETWASMEADWRQIEDSGALERMHKRWVLVAGRWMKGWVHTVAGETPQYGSLLEYMEETIGVVLPRQIAAAAAGLATLNLCSVAELFGRYQPTPEVAVQREEAQAG